MDREAREEAYEAAAYEAQFDKIYREKGEAAANKANYGWGVIEKPRGNGLSIATKVYGHGVLQTEVDFDTGAMEHIWL